MAIYLQNALISALSGAVADDDLLPVVRPTDGQELQRAEASQLKQFTDGGFATVNTNANFTLTVFDDAETQHHTGTLTADRAVTLATSGAYAGARFHIFRTGGGAFDLNVGTGPLKALATDTWATFVYSGSAWHLAAYGDL